jgi:Flp pilus assembly protein TadB
VSFGLAGVVFGTAFVDIFDDGAIDSSVRFFKGMLLAIGLIYWSCIRDIERRGERMTLVTFILVCGAASRLMAVIGHGVATLGILLSLIAGLILVPLLWLWQRHVADAARRGAFT